MNFTELNSTGLCEGYALVKTSEVKMTTKNQPYLDMTLTDKSGEINAKLWDYKGEAFEPYSLVKVRGTLSSYNDADQLRIEKIRLVNEDDHINIEDYVPSAEYSGEAMIEEIVGIINEFENEDLRTLVYTIIEKNYEDLVYWPAAKSNHHAIRGGLLMHTLSILRIAEGICKVYSFVNKDLLYTGIILHDIAKLEELNVSSIGVASEYTPRGTLIGHLVGGAIMVDRIGRELGIPDDTLTLVEHMLISHHGQAEWGAAKVPMFIEAEILAQLDVLDARMYEYKEATDGTEPNAFSAPQRPLGGKSVYNHGMMPAGTTNLI